MFAPKSLKTASFAGLTLALLAGVSRAAEGEKEGMPQLDPHSYASQLFWLTIFFILVFLFLIQSRGTARIGRLFGPVMVV